MPWVPCHEQKHDEKPLVSQVSSRVPPSLGRGPNEKREASKDGSRWRSDWKSPKVEQGRQGG